MLGILYYLMMIAGGICIARWLLKDMTKLTILSIGLGLGIVLGAWLPAIFALITGHFNALSHVLAAGVLLSAIGALCYRDRKRAAGFIELFTQWDRSELTFYGLLIVPFLLVIYWIFHGHVLWNVDGHVYGGQSTYGDLAMHLGMITSIARQGVFPPDYSIMPGVRLSYPFLVNAQSASLYMMGTSLRWSVILPSMVMSLSCFLGFAALARTFTHDKRRIAMAVLLFFITGGLGFFYFLDDPVMLEGMFTQYYQAPTNYPPFNLRWVNVICDMMVPQRTLLMGWSVLIPLLVLLRKANQSLNRRMMLMAGVMAASLPMIHTHSFLALGILCGGLLLMGYAQDGHGFKRWTGHWLIFLLPVILLAVPQLLFWIFNQAGGFVKPHLDWVNDGDPWLWFWFKNLGLPLLLMIPALIWGRKKYGIVFLSATLIFILSEFIIFQPNPYDNNKLMLVWYMFACIMVADYIFALWDGIRDVRGSQVIAGVVCVLLFASGLITITREIISNGQYQQYNADHLAAAKALDEHTPTDALVITGPQHLNAPAALAGRNIHAGSTLYLHFHGLDYNQRYAELQAIYAGGRESHQLLEQLQADYLYISSYESYQYHTSAYQFPDYPVVFQQGEVTILAVSSRAVERGSIQAVNNEEANAS